MADDVVESGELFSRESRRREELLTAFEEAWFTGSPPDLEAFVRRHLPPWLPRRDQTIGELIRVDQEFRVKRGEGANVEGYLERFSDYRPAADELLDLIVGEFNLRSRFQVPPTVAEYESRFPQVAGELRRQLTGRGEAASIDGVAPEAGAVLHVVEGPHRGTAIRLEPGRPLLVGRAGGADVRLDEDRHLSRFHIRLEMTASDVRFRDLNSRNGTTLDGRVVTEGRLERGQVLRCGETEFKLAAESEATFELRPERSSAPLSTLDGADARFAVPGYEMTAPLGRGSLGATWRAVRVATSEEVALKRIGAPGAAERITAVIRETAMLREDADPVLLLPVDLGLAGGQPYVVTPYHQAISFETLTAEMETPDRVRVACRVAMRLLAALGRAHGRGLVHGDVKPTNVLLERAVEGLRVKLTDFGLRRLLAPTTQKTMVGDDLRGVARVLRQFVGEGRVSAGDAAGRLGELVRWANERGSGAPFADAEGFRQALRPFIDAGRLAES